MSREHLTRVYSESGDEVPPHELARLLGELRYDSLREYLVELAAKLQKDSEGDGGRGRGQLAGHLQRAVWSLDEAALEIDRAWKICMPYMPVSKAAEEKKA
jgi:hypothetical protein